MGFNSAFKGFKGSCAAPIGHSLLLIHKDKSVNDVQEMNPCLL
jgi:hypothetical protein